MLPPAYSGNLSVEAAAPEVVEVELDVTSPVSAVFWVEVVGDGVI